MWGALESDPRYTAVLAAEGMVLVLGGLCAMIPSKKMFSFTIGDVEQQTQNFGFHTVLAQTPRVLLRVF